MHSGIIHVDGSSDFRYSKSMALLLYTLEYVFGSFVHLSSIRYQSENDQSLLRSFEKPPSPQLVSSQIICISKYIYFDTSRI